MNVLLDAGAAWIFIKIFALIGLVVYLVFAAIIVRQEQLMANVLEETFEPILRVMSLIHLIAALAVFLLAIIIL